jgi:hypothetical protein
MLQDNKMMEIIMFRAPLQTAKQFQRNRQEYQDNMNCHEGPSLFDKLKMQTSDTFQIEEDNVIDAYLLIGGSLNSKTELSKGKSLKSRIATCPRVLNLSGKFTVTVFVMELRNRLKAKPKKMTVAQAANLWTVFLAKYTDSRVQRHHSTLESLPILTTIPSWLVRLV